MRPSSLSRRSSPPAHTLAPQRRQRILDEIASAARVAKRDPDDICLIAVSKTRSAEQIEELIGAGQRDFVQDSLTALGGNAHRVGYR